jgi:hypothetical protein
LNYYQTMNAEIKRLFVDYLDLTDDKVAAANLVVADALLSGRSLSKAKAEPGLASPRVFARD